MSKQNTISNQDENPSDKPNNDETKSEQSSEKSTESTPQATSSNDKQDTWQPKKKSPTKRLLALGLLVVGVLGILYAYQLPPFSPNYVETNNAYVRGKPVVISPKVAGYVKEIMVQDYEWVEKDQPLVQIETDQYEMKLAQAQAGVLS